MADPGSLTWWKDILCGGTDLSWKFSWGGFVWHIRWEYSCDERLDLVLVVDTLV